MFFLEKENIWKRKAKIAKCNTRSPIMIYYFCVYVCVGWGLFFNSECTITGFKEVSLSHFYFHLSFSSSASSNLSSNSSIEWNSSLFPCFSSSSLVSCPSFFFLPLFLSDSCCCTTEDFLPRSWCHLVQQSRNQDGARWRGRR